MPIPPLLALLVLLAAPLAPTGGATRQTPTACPADAHEPNNERARAVRLEGPVADGVICPGEVDWYAIHLPRGQPTIVAVLHERSEAPDPPAVYPPFRRASAGKPYVSLGEIGTRFVAERTGWYRIRVTHHGTEPVPYVLFVSPTSLEER